MLFPSAFRLHSSAIDENTGFHPAPGPDPYDPKIYLLPNLMTAGNLFCGFAATLKIISGTLIQAPVTAETVGRFRDIVWSHGAIDRFHDAIWFILGACVFDVLDGRLARLGGQDSPFGREFDSLADTVSFGLAPALLVYKIVLDEFGRIGMLIAFLYLACGTLRLARFNCIAAASEADHGAKATLDQGKQFKGFPIPAAAGVIASLTELLLWFDEGQRQLGAWKFALPPLMIFLSYMMFSHFRYPSFKAINWRTQRTLPALLVILVLILLTMLYYQWMPAVIFLTYLMYGFLRPWLSRPWRRSIEQEIGEGGDDDEDEEEETSSEPAPPDELGHIGNDI